MFTCLDMTAVMIKYYKTLKEQYSYMIIIIAQLVERKLQAQVQFQIIMSCQRYLLISCSKYNKVELSFFQKPKAIMAPFLPKWGCRE